MIIAIVLAIVAVCASVVFLNLKTVSIEQTQLKQISADTTAQKLVDQRIDNIITIHNATVEHYDDEIDQIIARMDQIVADIAELNKEHISDHRDLVDIRQRYILYREPSHPNGGVQWSEEIKASEDAIDG